MNIFKKLQEVHNYSNFDDWYRDYVRGFCKLFNTTVFHLHIPANEKLRTELAEEAKEIYSLLLKDAKSR